MCTGICKMIRHLKQNAQPQQEKRRTVTLWALWGAILCFLQLAATLRFL